MTETRFRIEFNPSLPPALDRLAELAGDLHYSWDRYTRGLFYLLDTDLWHRCGHNPRVFLRHIAQEKLEKASRDRTFMESYQRALANYDAYMASAPGESNDVGLPAGTEPVVYLCAEFGLHESLPIYSGGLGILAGDLCKAASDMRLPFIAVGLLYRFGNFVQEIDADGHQNLRNELVSPDDLPLERTRGADGTPLFVDLQVGAETVRIESWWLKAGHARILLLDTTCAANMPEAQCITHHLYPGDYGMRLRQEIVLGVGAVEVLAALGIEPSVWHVNEGHPALAVVGRCAHAITAGLSLDTALELVRANTVFTTHTPVAAGHEVFPNDQVATQLGPYIESHGMDLEAVLALGANSIERQFSLTALALRCSGGRNGVSAMHGEVASNMEARIWPDIAPAENPIEYVTNGVHVPTFLAREWIREVDDIGWREEMCNADYWQRAIEAIPHEAFWSVHRALKRQLVEELRRRLIRRGTRLGWSSAQVAREFSVLDRNPDVMVIGFARRFAAYKRATLLLEDRDRLARLLGDPERPVVILFAGRAHQSDAVGQGLVAELHRASREPRFHGRILLLEGYDQALARKLVSGVDLWLNTPEFPFEASGTSGMKAAINGALNLSVADGWWREGYDGANGWSIEPHPGEQDTSHRRALEANELLDVLEHEVLPLYFDRRDSHSDRWVALMKRSMTSILPRFNAERMLREYVEDFYLPAVERERRMHAAGDGPAAELAAWRAKVRAHWNAVTLTLIGAVPSHAPQGEAVTIEVEVRHPGLSSADITLECLVDAADVDVPPGPCGLLFERASADGETTRHQLRLEDGFAGLLDLRIRAYPCHELLAHRFDLGLMKWL